MAVLVIDQGGQSTRALVYHPDGSSGPLQRCPSPTVHHDDDRIEHDSETLLESVFSVVDDAQRSGNEPITAVGLATQRSSLLFWDAATGDALTPVVSWQDRRAAEELEALALDPVDVHARTGLRPTAHYGASKLRWFLDREPSWRPAAKRGEIHAGPLASWLALRLTESAGSGLADPANAQRTLLWNLRSCDWDPELLRRFDIPRALLPRCAPTTGPFGNVAAVGAPLALVTGDQSAVVFGDGDPNPNRIAVTLGTGAFLQRVTERPSDDAALLTSVVRVDSDRASYVREAVINGCASALERMISPNLRPPEHAPELERALSTVVDPPLFLNGVGGLGTPEWIADFESRWIGDGDGAERAVAVVESVAFGVARGIERLAAEAPGTEGDLEVELGGGLSALCGLTDRIAALVPHDLFIRSDAESTARGVATQLGIPPTGPSERMLQTPTRDPALETRYHRWREALAIATRGRY